VKPAPFEYHRPGTLDEALDTLAELGERAKLLAGGQSLVPLMNFRLATPEHLIDINELADLDYLAGDEAGLRIGALTRHRTLESEAMIASRWPLVVDAARYIGHPAIRTRGTVGGSLAHADPAAELPLVAITVGAEIVAARRGSRRTIAAADFFDGYLTTALAPDEMVLEVRLPAPAAHVGWALRQIARRHGDFALAAVATTVTLSAEGVIEDVRLGLGGVGPAPLRAARAEASLQGEVPDQGAIARAAELAKAEVEPDSDVHASASYRRHLIGVLVQEALVDAVARAKTSP
jgi:CO/xanthine dehydrogenase FAD-binding subunit